MLSLCMCLLFVQSADAQLLRRVFSGKSTAQVSSSCPGGVCPTAAAQFNSSPVQSTILAPFKAVDYGRGHWSYPGSLDSHLEGTHGVSTAGMSRQEKLNYHDSLHEGTAQSVVRSVPVHAPQAVTYNYPVQSTQQAFSGGSSGSRFSGGSSGSFAVGSMYKGEVITSIGTPLASASAPTTFGALGSRRDFKKALLTAAKQAQDDGDISAQDYRRLSFALKIPGVAAKMEAAMAEQAVESGVATAGAIDWDSLLAFIKEMIPIIMQLIQLFSDNLQINPDHPYVSKPIPEAVYVSAPSYEWYSAA